MAQKNTKNAAKTMSDADIDKMFIESSDKALELFNRFSGVIPEGTNAAEVAMASVYMIAAMDMDGMLPKGGMDFITKLLKKLVSMNKGNDKEKKS
jgi:hypothetical protein